MTDGQVRDKTAPVAWNQELEGAKMLLRSGLCPGALKTPEAVLFVILAGRDLGLSPVASLRGVTVIQGKIEVSADLQLGLYHRAGGKSQWTTLTDKEAVLALDAPWITGRHLSVWSMKDAERAGLVNQTWQKFPKAMLRSRAITQGLKDIGFDATAGLYAPGEIGGPEVIDAPDPIEPPTTDDSATESVVDVMAPLEPVLTLPAGVPKWGGQPIAKCPPKVLAAFIEWAEKDIERTQTYSAEVAACLDMLEQGEDVEEIEQEIR